MLQADAILDRVSGIAEDLKLHNLAPQIAACRQQLNGSEKIGVAVFGRFKAGKSSFLNHLTGRDVLPIGVVPLTAVITRLRYGSAERAEVRFLDGTAKPIPLDDIGLYVAEHENPDNTKQVALVEVELPALKPLLPLEFVDTPGLGSAFTYNTDRGGVELAAQCGCRSGSGEFRCTAIGTGPRPARRVAPPHPEDCASADEGGSAYRAAAG